jgi:hypothetical protein
MFKAMQARGATFCVFTAAVEKNYAKPTTYTKRPEAEIMVFWANFMSCILKILKLNFLGLPKRGFLWFCFLGPLKDRFLWSEIFVMFRR